MSERPLMGDPQLVRDRVPESAASEEVPADILQRLGTLESDNRRLRRFGAMAVSYTHLTLPTIYSV